MSQKTAPRKRSAQTRGKPKTPAKPPARAIPARTAASRPKAKKRGHSAERIDEERPLSIPRATAGYDEDDVLLSGGSIQGHGYGRCGGRVLSSRLEQQLCQLLSRHGVTHSHSPRHFEVRYKEIGPAMTKSEIAKIIAAYAPMIVLRGRGREGKTVVIEASSEVKNPVLQKIHAFRKQYGIEFYLIFVAPEEVLAELPVDLYDESCTTNDVGTLINRLAD